MDLQARKGGHEGNISRPVDLLDFALSLTKNSGRNHAEFVTSSAGLEGSTIRPDNDANKRIYGEKISAKDIVIAHETHVPPAAEGLISKLNAKTPKHKS